MLHTQNNFKNLGLAAILFAAIVFGFCCKKISWQFGCDDFGAFYSGKTATIQNIGAYFGYKTNDLTIMPSNMQDRPMSFFSVTYRPLTLVWYALECKLLNAENDTDAWPYFVVSIILHALCGAMFFLLLCHFVNLFYAMCAGFAFAFFPFMGRCLGPFSFQPFSVSLLFAMLSFWLFYRFFQTNSQWRLWLSALCFLLPLLMHELVITLPAWFGIIALQHFYSQKQKLTEAMIETIKVMLPFALVILGYFGIRAALFPPSAAHTQIFNPMTILSNFKIRFYDFVTFFVELFGLSFIKPGNRLLKLFGLVSVASWLIGLGATTSNRKNALLAMLGAAVFCWASLLVMHQSRYLYFALPLLISFTVLCAQGIVATNLATRILKKSVPLALIGISSIGYFENQDLMSCFLGRQTLIVDSLKNLASNEKIFNKNIFFVGVPHELFPASGIAQALWMYGAKDQDGKTVIYDDMLNTRSLIVNEPCYGIANQNLLNIKIVNSTVSIQTHAPDKIWMFTANPFGKKAQCTVGKVLKLCTDANAERSHEINVKLDPVIDWRQFCFVGWDYEKNHFIILNHA